MKKLIPADAFCAKHNIGISFIRSLQESGLIEITTIEETGYIPADRLQELERMVRLYYDLDINMEGIETIHHLLQRINAMHDEITALRNRLRLYETNE
jgi:hypothetical protein